MSERFFTSKYINIDFQWEMRLSNTEVNQNQGKKSTEAKNQEDIQTVHNN